MNMNINQVSKAELTKLLPGVGPAIADKIIEARPIADMQALEQVIPPTAWLKIQDIGMTFTFDKEGDAAPMIPGATVPPGGEPGAVAKAPPPQPIIHMAEPEPMTLRRLLPGQPLRPGASYLCIWNMRQGPQGEAWVPADAPVQKELGAWFAERGMEISFVHYGYSVYVDNLRNRPHVGLVLFEIIKEEEEDGEEEEKSG